MVVKKIIAWLHLWLGLVSGIVVVILSITGCLLVFEQEIKSFSYPYFRAEHLAGQEVLPPSKLYRAVEKALPGKEISSVWYHGNGGTAHFTVDSDSTVYVNPYTAQVIAMADGEDFFHFMDEGHTHLWLPVKPGQQIVSWSTFIFFILLITGIVLWWPKAWNKKGKEQSFTIKWKAKFKRLNYDLHNVLGFYSLIVALIFAFTGLIMGFAWFADSVAWLSGGLPPVSKYKAVSDTTALSRVVSLEQVDRAWHKAVTQIGELNQQEVIISFPKKASDAIYVCVDMYHGAWRDVYLDQHTLKELPVSQVKLKDTNTASWIRRSNYGLHVGEVGGLTTKVIYFLMSLICASLPVTGFYIWWGKKRKQWKKERRNKAAYI